MSVCDYGDTITMNSIFKMCKASFDYDDDEVYESTIVDALGRLGESCESTGTTTHVGAEVAVLDRIIDGDTIEAFVCPGNVCALAPLEPERFRMWHVSVDEINYPDGTEAKAWLATQIKTGDEISFDRKGEDPYGRILAIVYNKNGVNLNTALIASGYGRPWTAEESEEYESEVGGETGSTTAEDATLQFTGNYSIPDSIVLGSENWFSGEYTNIGTSSGKWWLGIRLQDENGVDWRYTGDSQYATTIAPGETKTLRAKCSPPTTLVGSLRTFLVLNRSE